MSERLLRSYVSFETLRSSARTTRIRQTLVTPPKTSVNNLGDPLGRRFLHGFSSSSGIFERQDTVRDRGASLGWLLCRLEDKTEGVTNSMNAVFLKLYVKFQSFWDCEEGQDLVEYALLMVIISLGLITSMNGIASALIKFFSNVSTSLA
jgi:pilus assembly protein Flp/PilA